MLELSDIQSSQQELEDYYAQLRRQHVTPAWIGGGISIEPHSNAVPYLWHWRDLRPQAMRAAKLVGTAQAERRVLRLTNPELPGVASNTLVANIQIVMPGEIARAHRHSAAALRLIIEGRGGYTVVNGERVPMYPGDLVLTPNWCWHDHANDTHTPMMWLDGLDTPLVRMLEAGFYEEYPEERQDIGAAVNASQWHYPMSEMRAALERLAAADTPDIGDGIILEYKNRVTGGPVMPTIACHMQLLRPGEKTQARRRVCCTNYHVVEGAGYSMVGEERLDWEDKDVFTVPTWTFCEHVNSGDRPAFLFSFSDAPVMKALSLYRDEDQVVVAAGCAGAHGQRGKWTTEAGAQRHPRPNRAGKPSLASSKSPHSHLEPSSIPPEDPIAVIARRQAPMTIVPTPAEALRPGTKYRALLGGGCHGLRCGNRSMGAEKGADMAHRQRNLVRGVLPRIKAHLRVGREMHGFHRYGIGVPRNVVGQHQDRRLAAAHEIARHGVHEIGASTPVHVGQESIDHRHRDVGPAGAQLRAPALHIVVVGEARHLRAVAAGLRRHGRDDAVAGPL